MQMIYNNAYQVDIPGGGPVSVFIHYISVIIISKIAGYRKSYIYQPIKVLPEGYATPTSESDSSLHKFIIPAQ